VFEQPWTLLAGEDVVSDIAQQTHAA
jgi:hypothetical protein